MPNRAKAVDSLGQADFEVFEDTGAHSPDGFSHWFAIRPLEADITPTAIETIKGDDLSGVVLTKDVIYVGRFINIQLAEGKIQAYRSTD